MANDAARVVELEQEVRQIANMVHQAHHDAWSDVAWMECGKAACRRAQHVLGIEAKA